MLVRRWAAQRARVRQLEVWRKRRQDASDTLVEDAGNGGDLLADLPESLLG